MAAPKASAIQNRTRTATFQIEAGEGEVHDWEIRYTPFSENKLKELIREGEGLAEDEQFAALRLFLAGVITGWNLTDDDGKPLPFDPDYLAAWGFDYVRQLQEGIVADMQVGKPSGSASSGGLRRVA
jgi:hypothetical protein